MTTKSVTTLMTTQKVVTQLGDHAMTTHDHTMTTPDHLNLSPFSLRKTFKTIEIWTIDGLLSQILFSPTHNKSKNNFLKRKQYALYQLIMLFLLLILFIWEVKEILIERKKVSQNRNKKMTKQYKSYLFIIFSHICILLRYTRWYVFLYFFYGL